MIQNAVFLLIGLVVLLASGDMLVRGAVSLANAVRVPPLLIGLTIVAFGTSAPELVVAIQAVLEGRDGIAIGNIVGSNIANVLLVLGVPAVIYPMNTHVEGLPRNAAFMVLATLGFAAIAYLTGTITFTLGLALLAGIVVFIGFAGIRAAKSDGNDPVLDDVASYADEKISARTIVFLVFGLIGLPFGAHLLVDNGATIAETLGVRDAVIGLTIVAFGTSLPELATVLAAAVHKKSDVAIGNIVGSNVFNLLAVGGAAGVAGGATFDRTSLSLDIPVMLLVTALLAGYVFSRNDIGRISGVVMCIAYALFVAALAVRGV
ncbi:MAG: calcium/sodium antiporter [Pseudomonadota bacterium]